MLSMNTALGCAACCFGCLLLVAAILLVALLLDVAAKTRTALCLRLTERESDMHDALVWLQAQGCRWSALSRLRFAQSMVNPVPAQRVALGPAAVGLRRRERAPVTDRSRVLPAVRGLEISAGRLAVARIMIRWALRVHPRRLQEPGAS